MANLKDLNRFTSNPVNLDISRSKFKRPYLNTTTLLTGDLVPIYVDEVLPGDSVQMDISSVVRMITPAVPVMDNAFLDLYAFWVPNRLCTKHPNDWQKICGENFDGFWANNVEYTLENTGNTYVTAGETTKNGRSLSNYFGLGGYHNPSINKLVNVNALPFRGYVKIWNEWFRDENLQNPLDPDYYASGNLLDTTKVVLQSNKLHDYFTSALPSPQKGASVLLPLLGTAPIIASDVDIIANNSVSGAKAEFDNNNFLVASGRGESGYTLTGNNPSDFYADLSRVTGATVNELRLSFALQRILEKDSRGGSRFTEMLKSHFGIAPSDSTLQRPEYLGGKRIPLEMNTVVQTSATGTSGGVNVLGETGAYSNTNDLSAIIPMKSFNEHGYLYVLATIRTNNTYYQGLPKLFMRNRRYDFYYPAFANIGEQPVYKYEIYNNDVNRTKDSGFYPVFGYQEAWAEYRFKPNQLTGYMNPLVGDEILNKWTYAQELSNPSLGNNFIKQESGPVDQVLAITSNNYHFICNFYFDTTMTRPMPVFSIPGLLDHH